MTREDLSIGEQACQLAHAMREFAANHPETELQWYEESNHVCFLVVKDEAELESLVSEALERYIKVSTFREPDLDNILTAAAFEPIVETRQLVSQLPLAFKRDV